MAGVGEQIVIYSSQQLFLIHKCFINLTHDLKLELYYNTDGNCFPIEPAQLQFQAAHVGNWKHFSHFCWKVCFKQSVPSRTVMINKLINELTEENITTALLNTILSFSSTHFGQFPTKKPKVLEAGFLKVDDLMHIE